MGIDVGIWKGDVVTSREIDLRAEASHVVAPGMYEDESFPVLSGIDPYGNTIFNRVLLPALSPNWNVGYGRSMLVLDVGRWKVCWPWRESATTLDRTHTWCSLATDPPAVRE